MAEAGHQKDPEKGLYWFNLGNLYFVMQNYREAQVAYRQVQALESPLSPVAGLYEVRSLRQSARLAPAYRLYLKLKRGLFPENLKKELDEEHTLLAQSLLEKGLTLWSKGLNRAARHHLRASAELNPSLQVYKALALLEWRDGSKRKGRYYYRRAMRLASSNAEIQEMEKDWRQVDRGKITRFWLESGLIHNDNYFNDDSNTDGESGQGVKLQTGLEGYLGEGDNWDLSGRIKATHTDYTNLDNQETSVIGAYFPFAYAGGDNHRWRVTPKVEQELFLGKPLLLHGGLVLEWVRPLGVGQIISASGELIKSTAQNNDFSFLDGGTVNAGLAYSWIWSRSRLKLQILAEDYQADPYEDGLGGSLPLAHHRWELSLTYGLRGEIWEGFGSVSYGEKSFPNFCSPTTS